MVKFWKEFTTKTKINCFDFEFKTSLAFLEFARDRANGSFNFIKREKNFITVMRNLTDKPFTPAERFTMEKYVSASFNLAPLQMKHQENTWDVNVLLDYFVKLGPNLQIKQINVLAGKLALQLLLTQACRSVEICQIELSTMTLLQGGVQFRLRHPTKTFTASTCTRNSKLQLLSVKEFLPNRLLCLVTTLLDYIEITKPWRGSVDNLFVLMTTQEPRPATQKTIVRWAKDVMALAGLGKFTVHSNRSATSTNALSMGMPIDAIVSRVGWL